MTLQELTEEEKAKIANFVFVDSWGLKAVYEEDVYELLTSARQRAYEDGYKEGYEIGYSNGDTEGYEKGLVDK